MSTAIEKSKKKTGSRDHWATPQHLFDEWNREFNFTIDVCASKENHKHLRYWTEEDDALAMSWAGETWFCNPPYSQLYDWTYTARLETSDPTSSGVMLVPCSTETRWFHECVLPFAVGIRLLRTRVEFIPSVEYVIKRRAEGKPETSGNMWPSMLVVYGKRLEKTKNLWRFRP